MQKVLVTGASGALGKAVLSRLLAQGGYEVVLAGRQRVEGNFVALDLNDPLQVRRVMTAVAPDLILHLAATFSNDFDEAQSVNVQAAHALLEAVAQSAGRPRLLLIGSAAEYGVIEPSENPVSEDHALNPVSVYGLSKAWQSQLARLYAARGIDVVVARVFNLDGPGLGERLFIGRLQKQIGEVLAGAKDKIEIGALTATRDYVSTDEAAQQILTIAASGSAGEVYHVASGVPVTMHEILMRYLKMNQLDPSIVSQSIETSTHQGYDVPVIYADMSKTMSLAKRG